MGSWHCHPNPLQGCGRQNPCIVCECVRLPSKCSGSPGGPEGGNMEAGLCHPSLRDDCLLPWSPSLGSAPSPLHPMGLWHSEASKWPNSRGPHMASATPSREPCSQSHLQVSSGTFRNLPAGHTCDFFPRLGAQFWFSCLLKQHSR